MYVTLSTPIGDDPIGPPSTPEPVHHVDRIVATVAAQALIERLRSEHGDLVFHQSGGCCDNSSACCLLPGELHVGPADLLLGLVGGVPYHCPRHQYATWAHTQLILDVVEASGGGGGFSLEGPLNLAFIIRSRVFTPQEQAWLAEHPALPAPGAAPG